MARDREYPPGILERVQEIESNMLAEFDRICRKYGLTYWADGGTCLGAVRHKGFIPWDDDIDIGMPLEDFRRFAEVCEDELPAGMTFSTPQNNPNMLVLWGKLYASDTLFVERDAWEIGVREGIFIDVIPYIQLNESADGGHKQLKRTQRWAKLNYIYRIKSPSVLEDKRWRALGLVAWRVARALLHLVSSPQRIMRGFERDCACMAPSEVWANPAAAHPYPYRRDVLFDPVEVQFGDLVIYAPHDCDAYLRELYGDYMVVPDPEHRHTHTPYMLNLGDGIDIDLRQSP